MTADRETTFRAGPKNPRDALPRDPGRRRRVLFAAYPGGRPTGALLRAHAFARLFGGDLTVLRVLPGAGRPRPEFPRSTVLSALARLEMITGAVRRTRGWADAILPTSLRWGVIVREGDFEATVIQEAIRVAADFIVLPPAEGRSGQRVTAITVRTGVPVLVAREVMSSEAVVAASDLRDSRFPVVTQAMEIAARIGAKVAVVHNVSAEEVDAAYEGEVRLRIVGVTGEIERRRHRLSELSESMAAEIEPVVVSRSSPTEAILAAARERDADLVVVGARADAEEEDGLAGGTAAAVIESSRRSILVLPFSGAGAA